MKNFITLILLVFFLPSNPVKAQADFQLSVDLIKAIKEHSDGYEQLNKLTSIVKNIEEKGEKPAESELENNWNTLAQSYRDASDDIKSAKLPADFSNQFYKITPEQFNNCFSKDANLDILSRYSTALSNAVTAGKLELDKIQTEKKEIAKSFVALNYLIDGYVKFSSEPIYGGLFTSDLFSLLNTVKPELGEYSASLNQYEKKLIREVKAAELHGSNLQNNINTLRGSFCLLEGVFNGESPGSSSFTWRHQLNLKRSGNSYSGKITMVKSNGSSRRESNISNVSISGSDIRFNATWGGYSGKINSSFSRITMSDPYSATYVMSK